MMSRVSPVRALPGLDPGGDHELGGAAGDLLASHHDLLELAAAQHDPAKLCQLNPNHGEVQFEVE